MRIIKIQINDAGQRLDKFLRKLLDKASLSLIFKLLRTNQIKLNHKKVKPEIILQEDDDLRIYLDEDKLKLFSTVLFADKEHQPKEFSLQDLVLYQDEEVLVLNKPPFILVHPGGRFTHSETLIYKIHEFFHSEALTFKPAFVHRLDRETSGVILVALTMRSLQELTRQIKEREITKKYITLVKGRIDKQLLITNYKLRMGKQGIEEKTKENWYTIDAPILKTYSENGYHNVGISEEDDAKTAVTHFRILKYFDECTLCEVLLETGRMHQIRLHMRHIGYPVVGDDLYGDKKFNKLFLQRYNLSRQFLHASSLTFIHPVSGKKITVEAPLTEDLRFVNSGNLKNSKF